MSSIRTRFAPSPTGYMHIGNLRTALFAFLLAKSKKGKFILRIEDTDEDRRIEGSLTAIYKTLSETGLVHDEGPDIGGNYGPYVQSQRKKIYEKYIKKLLKLNGCYHCFCEKERLEALRVQQTLKKIPPRYDGRCRELSQKEITEKLSNEKAYIIRQKIPKSGTTSFFDEIFGEISVNNCDLDDSILLKQNGMPTYNFANVIDDHFMEISHVVRGNEYLSSTPKYNLLYNSYGWMPPTYIHLPPIIKSGGKKLSKREGDSSYSDLIKKGYLSDAIVNYIALLGWSPKSEDEMFSLSDLIERFDISGIGKSPAVFDEKKLTWLNSQYIKSLSFDKFHEFALPYYKKYIKNPNINLHEVSKLLHTRCERFCDIEELVDFIDNLPNYDVNLFCHKKMKTTLENSLQELELLFPILSNVKKWTHEEIHKDLLRHIEFRGVKNSTILWPLRVAVSGKAFTPGGGIELSFILGKTESLKRIDIAVQKLKETIKY